MLEFLISAANVVGLMACGYIACISFTAVRTHRGNAARSRVNSERAGDFATPAPARPDYYYVM